MAAAKLQDHARRRAHGAASTSAPASPLAPRSPLAPGAGARLGGGGSAGSTRLRDAIVWGYMMQRHGARSMVGFPQARQGIWCGNLSNCIANTLIVLCSAHTAAAILASHACLAWCSPGTILDTEKYLVCLCG